MADKYGDTGHDHEQDQGAQTESWHDDRPPVDDFADPEQSGEESVTVSHESEPGMDDQEILGRRKPMVLPLIAGVGGLLILGSLVYWQFGRAPQPPVTTPSVVVASQNTATLPVPSAPSTSSSAGDTDLNSLYAGAKEPPPASANTAADIAPKTDLAPVPSAPATQAVPENPPAEPALPTAPTTAMTPPLPPPPATGAPSGTAVLAEVAVPEKPSPVPPVHTAAPAQASAADSARLAALEARLEGLEKSLEQATKQLSQVSNMVAATAPVSGSGAEDRIARIEQGLRELEQTKPAPAVAAPTPAEVPETVAPIQSGEPSLQPPPFEQTAQEAVPPPVQAKPKAKAKAKTVSQQKTKPRAAKPVTTIHWVLRAATPEEAWVSESSSSTELRHVGIGDTLPGIGRIKSIRQVGEEWVVEGSGGTVR